MRWNDEVNVPTKNVKLHSDKIENLVSKQNQVVLHKVVILDCSGSMRGAKYNAAEQGIRADYQLCKEQGFEDYLLVEFSESHTEKLYQNWEPITFNPRFRSTALYSTIHFVLNKVYKEYSKDDKVLVQIFTDGEDTDSSTYRERAAAIIAKFNEIGWTVTFVGTEQDVEFIQKNLNVDVSNTLVHDNTGEGVAKSFDTYFKSTVNYMQEVQRGADVTRGFFKNTTNE